MVRTRWLAALVAVMLLGVLAACGGDDEDPADAEAQLCEDLALLETSLNNVAALNADSTIDEVETAQDNVEDAWASVEDSAEDVEDARADELSSAVESLNQAFDNIEADAPIDEAVALLQADVTAVQTAWTQLFESVDCATS